MESIFESLENLNVSEECFEDIVGIIETLVGKYKEEGIPATSYSTHHKRNISDSKIKDEMKKELYPKEANKRLDRALKNQEEHDKILRQGRDLDDNEPLKRMSELSHKIENDKMNADMYIRKADARKLPQEVYNKYAEKRSKIRF